MSPILVAFILAAGVSAWVYNKVMQRTGNNTQNAIIIASVAAVMAFVLMLTVLSVVDSILES